MTSPDFEYSRVLPDEIAQWSNEVGCHIERVYPEGIPPAFILILDIDETVFGTAERWLQEMSAEAARIGRASLVNRGDFARLGGRAHFSPILGEDHYERFRDGLTLEEHFYRGLPRIPTDEDMERIARVRGFVGGYLTGRPPSIRDVTAEALLEVALPQAPILCQPSAYTHPEGAAYKGDASLYLRQALDIAGLAETPVILIDDYPGIIEAVNGLKHPMLQGIVHRGGIRPLPPGDTALSWAEIADLFEREFVR